LLGRAAGIDAFDGTDVHAAVIAQTKTCDYVRHNRPP
jgi:hypothetical protein